MTSLLESVSVVVGEVKMSLEDQMTQILSLHSGQTLVPQGMTQLPQDKMQDPNLLFSEQQNGFGMPNIGSLLKIQNGNVLVIALGVIVSSSLGGMIMGYLPSMGQYATLLAGIGLIYFGKGKSVVRDLGVGVLIGGLAAMFSGLGSSLGAMLPGQTAENPPMMEDKVTYGGTDGINPINPDRRIFA